MTAANKYGNFLTILLVILIVTILGIGGFLLYKFVIKPRIDDDRAIEAIAEFDKNIEENEQEEGNNDKIETTEGTSSGGKNKVYYQGFVMLGYITIPKTNVKQPILDQVTPDSLNAAVAALYPSNAQLNEPGNIVIVGHNYRNGKFFSNNNKLTVGDKITIKDNTGRELSYTIYNKFQTSEQDTSFYTRNTNGKAEITLSTCTDDSKARIIILARAD